MNCISCHYKQGDIYLDKPLLLLQIPSTNSQQRGHLYRTRTHTHSGVETHYKRALAMVFPPLFLSIRRWSYSLCCVYAPTGLAAAVGQQAGRPVRSISSVRPFELSVCVLLRARAGVRRMRARLREQAESRLRQEAFFRAAYLCMNMM